MSAEPAWGEEPDAVQEPPAAASTEVVFEFEGETVVGIEGQLPAISLEMDSGYPRGTHLRLMVEVRVRNVRYEEDRKGNLVRKHVFALETAELVSSFKAEDVRDDVGGSASAGRLQTPDEAEELGVSFGRSSQAWPA